MELSEKSEKIKIIVDKGEEFGIFSLFTNDSTKEHLKPIRSIAGNLLSDLGIQYNIGDEINISSTRVRVYNISTTTYYCEIV